MDEPLYNLLQLKSAPVDVVSKCKETVWSLSSKNGLALSLQHLALNHSKCINVPNGVKNMLSHLIWRFEIAEEDMWRGEISQKIVID
jgi:hypothetical protein